ncbi:MAG: hypothetical protein JNJ58_12165 [Chitinophagaceae bacterium]|nr:hypothetical protein [Chitinophagaceae bacterium]
MKTKKISFNLSAASYNQVINKAQLILSKMSANTNFPNPDPSLPDIQLMIDKVIQLHTEQKASYASYQEKSGVLNDEKDKLIVMLENLGHFVQAKAEGNENLILNAGFELKQTPTKSGKPDAPENVLAKAGPKEGEIVCTWNTVKGAKIYKVEMNDDVNNAATWTEAALVTKAKCSIENLTPGTKVWIRVAAIGAAGQGPWGDVCTKIVS